MTPIAKLDLRNLFFIVILIVLGVLMLQIFAPFINIIVLSLVIVQLFHPVYKGILKVVGSQSLASLITTLITLVTVILPIIAIGGLAAVEVTNAIGNLGSQVQNGSVPLNQQQKINPDGTITSTLQPKQENTLDIAMRKLELGINDGLNNVEGNLNDAGINIQISPLNLDSAVRNFLETLRSNLLPFAGGLISFSINLLFTGFMFIITLLYLFISYDKLPQIISKISPLDDELDQLLLRSFRATNRAVIAGSFVVAIAQASAVSIILVLLGVGAPVLLWVLMVFLSLIPVGSGLVWFPVGIALIASGQPVVGIGLIAYSAIIINVIDAMLRPLVMRGSTHLHPLIIIFSALGGIGLFGPIGILYGPVIAVFFASLMEVYNRKFGNRAVVTTNDHVALQ